MESMYTISDTTNGVESMLTTKGMESTDTIKDATNGTSTVLAPEKEGRRTEATANVVAGEVETAATAAITASSYSETEY